MLVGLRAVTLLTEPSNVTKEVQLCGWVGGRGRCKNSCVHIRAMLLQLAPQQLELLGSVQLPTVQSCLATPEKSTDHGPHENRLIGVHRCLPSLKVKSSSNYPKLH